MNVKVQFCWKNNACERAEVSSDETPLFAFDPRKATGEWVGASVLRILQAPQADVNKLIQEFLQKLNAANAIIK